jgi:hypothetical protein
VDGHPVTGHRDVLAVEARAAAEGDPLAVREHARVPEALADLGIGGEGEGGPVHVELGVAPGVPAARDRKVQELVTVCGQGVADGLEQGAALGESQGAERRPALRAREVEGGLAIDPTGAGPGQGLLGGRIHEGVESARPLDPSAAHVASKGPHPRPVYCVTPTEVSM